MLLQKLKVKQSHQDAFAEESQTEALVFASLTKNKHECKMADYDHCMVELELKKQHITFKAQEKQLEAEKHQIAAQYQSEHEKEKHDLEMLHLCLQYQGGLGGSGLAASTAQFGMGPPEQFPNSNLFESLGMDSNSLT